MLFFMTALAHRIYCKIILEFSGEKKSIFRLFSSALDSGCTSCFCFVLFLNLHDWVFITISEFLTVLECARRGCKGLMEHGCRCILTLKAGFGQPPPESAVSSSRSASHHNVDKVLYCWEDPEVRDNSIFMQFLCAACVCPSLLPRWPLVLDGA